MSRRPLLPSDYNLLELYRQHRDEIDAITDPTSLFILAFTNKLGGANVNELAKDIGVSMEDLQHKLAPLVHAQFIAESRGRLTITPLGARVLDELGFITPPIPPTKPPEPPESPTHPGGMAGWLKALIVLVVIGAIVVIGAATILFFWQQPTPTPPPPPSPEIAEFVADRNTLVAGECVQLRWQVKNAEWVEVNGKRVDAIGTMQACPRTTITYVLIAGGGIGRTQSLMVNVAEPPQVQIDFFAESTNIKQGDCTVLVWNVRGGFAVTLDKALVDRTGKIQVCPQETTTFGLAVDAGTEIRFSTVTINVERVPIPGITRPVVTPRIVTPTFTPTLTRTPTRTPTPITPLVDNAAPAPPTGLTPSGNQLLLCPPSTVPLTWNAASDPSGIARYDWALERSNSPSGPYVAYSSGSTGNTSVSTTVLCGVWFRWRVRAVDGVNNVGAYSNYANFSMALP